MNTISYIKKALPLCLSFGVFGCSNIEGQSKMKGEKRSIKYDKVDHMYPWSQGQYNVFCDVYCHDKGIEDLQNVRLTKYTGVVVRSNFTLEVSEVDGKKECYMPEPYKKFYFGSFNPQFAIGDTHKYEPPFVGCMLDINNAKNKFRSKEYWNSVVFKRQGKEDEETPYDYLRLDKWALYALRDNESFKKCFKDLKILALPKCKIVSLNALLRSGFDLRKVINLDLRDNDITSIRPLIKLQFMPEDTIRKKCKEIELRDYPYNEKLYHTAGEINLSRNKIYDKLESMRTLFHLPVQSMSSPLNYYCERSFDKKKQDEENVVPEYPLKHLKLILPSMSNSEEPRWISITSSSEKP